MSRSPLPLVDRTGPDWWAVPAVIAWVGLLAWTIWYTAAHAHNMPMQDEWDFIPVLFGKEDKASWLVEPHNQHRYILGRTIYLALHTATGNWFPSGCVLTVALMGLSALLLTRTARRLRGRFHPADAWYSVLLLCPGHHETLLMGYQIVFTLTTAALVLVLCQAALLPTLRPSPAVGLSSVLLLPLVLGGGLGLVFFAPVGAWVGYLALRSLNRDGWRRTLLAFLPAAVTLAFGVWSAFDILSRPTPHASYGLGDTVRHTTEFLAVGFGAEQTFYWPPLRWLITVVEGITALGLAGIAIRSPDERPVSLGWLAVLVGVVLTGVVIGYSRPDGFVSRYAAISCLGPCVCLLAATRYIVLPRPLSLSLGLLSLPLAVSVWWLNTEPARYFAWTYQTRHAALRADIRDGVPIGFISDRVAFFPNGYEIANFRLLRDAGFRPLVGIPDDPPLTVTTVRDPDQSGIPAWNGSSPAQPPSYRLPALPDRAIGAVRFHYRCEVASFWQRYVLHWSTPDGRAHRSEVFAWLTPGDWSFSFWLASQPTEAWLESTDPTPSLTITRVEYFFPASASDK